MMRALLLSCVLIQLALGLAVVNAEINLDSGSMAMDTAAATAQTDSTTKQEIIRVLSRNPFIHMLQSPNQFINRQNQAPLPFQPAFQPAFQPGGNRFQPQGQQFVPQMGNNQFIPMPNGGQQMNGGGNNKQFGSLTPSMHDQNGDDEGSAGGDMNGLSTFGDNDKDLNHEIFGSAISSNADDIFGDCGIKRVTNFVAGGHDGDHSDWPWHVQLVIHNTEFGDSETYCGGTLITKNHVVTASHCYDDMSDERLAPSTRVLFKGLRLDYTDVFEAQVHKVIKHPSYIPAMTEFEARIQKVRPGPLNDIAIIVLKRLPDHVHRKLVPACLPSKFAKLKEKTQCKVMGHGFTSRKDEQTFTMPSELQVADVRISLNHDCRMDVESKSIREKINDRTVCVRGPVHPCVGDSGGPLVCTGAKNYKIDGSDFDEVTDEQAMSPNFSPRRWYLMGVTSFAVSTDEHDACGEFKSAVFGFTPRHLDFIKRVIFDRSINRYDRRRLL